MEGGFFPWLREVGSQSVEIDEADLRYLAGRTEDAATGHETTHDRAQGRTALEGTGVGSAQGDAGPDAVDGAMGWWTASNGL